MTQYTVRPAVPDDAPTIARFNQAMAQETEGKALTPEILEAGVGQVFKQPSHGRYLVAQTPAGLVVGCLLITYEWSDWRNGQIWWIQSVYVDPAHRQQGVFKLLYRQVHEMGKQTDGVVGYRLYVERDNAQAQKTYQSLGMSQTPYLIYEAIDDGPKTQ